MQKFWFGVFAAVALAACMRRPYQDPAYAELPHINLSMDYHGGNGLVRVAREIRYQVEVSLAENKIAVASGAKDDQVPEFRLDLVDRGILPGAEARALRTVPMDPYSGSLPEGRIDATDGWLGSLRGDEPRIVDAVVYMRRPGEQDLMLLGRVRGVIGYDFAWSTKIADMMAALIQQGLAG